MCQIGKERVLSAGPSVRIQSDAFATEHSLKPLDSNKELEAPFQTDAKIFSLEAVYSKVAKFLVTFSVFFGQSEEH